MGDIARLVKSSPLYGGSAPYVQELHELFCADPMSVPEAWRNFFSDGMAERSDAAGFQEKTLARDAPRAKLSGERRASRAGAVGTGKAMAVAGLVAGYRTYGCRKAKFNPIEIDTRKPHPSLDFSYWGLGETDMDTEFDVDIVGLPCASLRNIIKELELTYCGTLSVEYMHMSDPRARQWFMDNYEGCRAHSDCDAHEKRKLLRLLVAAENIENHLNTRFTGQKRFSLEGSEALIAMLDIMLREALDKGVVETVVGMAHRGRLNVLVNILGKSPQSLFEEFEGKTVATGTGSGDVKYHMGFSSKFSGGEREMHLALAFNPSHLEIVNPVVEGSVRARQDRRHDKDGSLVLPVLIHGDAAISGQGVVMETLNMSQTDGYGTGGTVHIVINNQIGFTISHLDDARSTHWCTDIAKMTESPVFHVSGDDPEAVALATRMAVRFRQEFCADVFIDLVSYRRLGHNEQDEPMVTQPFMYRKIKSHPKPAKIYADQLNAEGVIGVGDLKRYSSEYIETLKAGKSANPRARIAQTSEFVDWKKHLPENCNWDKKCETALDSSRFRELGMKLSEIPADFIPHSRLAKVIEARRKMALGELPVDWGMAENLAYASLVTEGVPIRLSGQDVGRGTFFHRHAAWHDQKRAERSQPAYYPLANMADDQASFQSFDSLLSEEAVLGFEYGYSTTRPDTMVVWEAQFGDFANGAQVVIDQFISSGEFKWGRYCGLVMLLPHGYEGQGPEHSSARLERYMQLCAEYNMQICLPTTAAQIFHLLRRQMLRPLRRPLIVMSPKSLLRHKSVSSQKDEICSSKFQPLIPETDKKIKPTRVRQLVVCSGKIYYELHAERARREINDIAIVRIEQIYPFPHEEFKPQIEKYSNAQNVLWCQEEPGNQGAYHRIQHYLRRHMWKNQTFRYALRSSSASTAAGRPSDHRKQQQEVIEAALTVK